MRHSTPATHGFGACAASASNEAQCSLNKDPGRDAEDPQLTAGTMNPANPTVPWVAWDEEVSGVKQIFVSRLVGAGASAHFQIVNNGAPISSGAGATRPDITFSGNTPYVSFRENVGGVVRGFVGHFINAANPTFVLDVSNVPLTPTAQADVREPISSSCTANPFNSDGTACQGGAVGTPFFLFTNGTSPRGLFAGAYQPGTVRTGTASGITSSSATVKGSVNPLGASVKVSFEFGTTRAYGSTTTPQRTGPDNHSDTFTAVLGGLPAGTTIHYRAVALSDFGKFVGADRTFITTGGAFNRKARLLSGGRKVSASGPAPVCKRGEKIFLTVRVSQRNRTATGTWPTHSCTGKPRQWHVVLTVAHGKKLQKGKATGQGSARITRKGRTVKIWRWSSKLTLVT